MQTLSEVHRNIDLSSCKSVSQLWAQIIGDCKKGCHFVLFDELAIISQCFLKSYRKNALLRVMLVLIFIPISSRLLILFVTNYLCHKT